MKATLEVINRMQSDGVIGRYAVGDALATTLRAERVATLDIDILVLPASPSGIRATPVATLNTKGGTYD